MCARPTLDFRWQIGTLAPFVPGAVVICQVGVAKHGKTEEYSCGSNTSITVGNNALLRLYTRKELGQFLIAAKCNASRINDIIARNAQSTRNMAATSMAAYYLAGILPPLTRIDECYPLLI